MLRKGQPSRVHCLTVFAELSGLEFNPVQPDLHVYVVEARYEEDPFPLPAHFERRVQS